MLKKFFLLCLAMLLVMQGAALAKEKGLPEEERVKVAIVVEDGSRHKDFGTAQNLEMFLREKLVEKNLVTVVDTKTEEDLILDEEVAAEKNFSAETVGEILIFDAVELPREGIAPPNFDQDLYKNLGADYVVRCEVLALGVTKVEDKAIGLASTIIGGGLSWSGSGDGKHDKTLRRVGNAVSYIGFLGMLDVTKRTALNTVVNMQFISVETGEIVWEKNFTGQAIRHHNPDKGYDDAWTQAYMESVEDSAKRISKRVNKYVDKVLIKGKSDKEFMPKSSSLSKLGGGKLF